MNDTQEAPLVKGGQGRDAESLIDSARLILIVSLCAFAGAVLGAIL